MNDNKIIKIERSVKSYGGSDNTWRTAFADMLSSGENAGKPTIFGNILSNTRTKSFINLLLEEKPPTLTVDNEYGRPLNDILNAGGDLLKSIPGASKISKILSTAGTVANLSITAANTVMAGVNAGTKGSLSTAGTFNPWVMQGVSWKESRELTFTYTFKFRLGQYGVWNAEEEVYKPIINLLAPALPQYLSNFTQSGNLPSTAQFAVDVLTNAFSQAKNAITGIFAERDDGTSASDEDTIKGTESLSDALAGIFMDAYEPFAWDISFGNIISFRKCIVKTAVVDFSNETDEKGFPISGSITWTCKTLIPIAAATSQDNLLSIRFGGN